jgi:hypothetical protein
MSYIENQLNNVIMAMDLPSEDNILQKEYDYFEPTLPRVYVSIPTNPSTRYLIDKIAKLVAREGGGYTLHEEIKRVIEKGKRVVGQPDNVLMRLFGQAGDTQQQQLQDYYQWRVFSYFNGDSTFSWSQHPFQYYAGSNAVIIPPRNPEDWQRLNPARVIKEAMLKEARLLNSSLGKLPHRQTEEDEEGANDSR